MSKRPNNFSESNNLKKIKKTDINDFINCVVCNEVILPPILQCSKGHLICSDCKKHCSNCPQCRCRLNTSRNFIFEKLIEDMKFKCKYLDCNEMIEYNNLKEHHLNCKNKPYTCYKSNCGFETNDKKVLIQHLIEKNKVKFIKLDDNKKKILLNFSEVSNDESDDESSLRRQVINTYQIDINDSGFNDIMSDLLGINTPNMAGFGRTMSHSQEDFLSWNQILIEHKKKFFILFFEKKKHFKIQLFQLGKTNDKIKYNLKFKNCDIEYNFKSLTTNNIEFEELRNSNSLEFIKDNKYCISILPSMIYKIYNKSQINFFMNVQYVLKKLNYMIIQF